MISAGSRDGRKMTRLGLDVAAGSEIEMEDTELEEGEACSYRNNEQNNFDLDDLTYIDEKLQNVLGHFKKDFEGGVFTENLGAKYGGYGSFLIQRSPARSYSRSPANVQNNQSQKSPTCLPAEGANRSLLAQSNGHRSVNPESASIHFSSSESTRHGLARQIGHTPRYSTENRAAKAEAVDKSTNINEPRTLKVRIKVGSDNLSAKKKAAIYSGLGLISPSSSFDDSPTVSEGLSQAFQLPGDESPNQIIQLMTSLPIHGVQLLSPLPEALARLTEKILHDADLPLRNNWGSFGFESNGVEAKILHMEDDLKPEGKNHLPTKRKKDSERALNDVILKNRADFGTQACHELVSEALKLPLLSDFHGTLGEKRGTSKKKSNLQSNVPRHEPLLPVIRSDGDWNERDNIAREEKEDLQNDVPGYQKKNKDSRGAAANSSTRAGTHDFDSKSMKGSLTGPSDSQKLNNGKESMLTEPKGMKLPLVGKKKEKNENYNGSVQNAFSNDKDSSVAVNHPCKTETESSPKKKDLTKVKDRYKDLFGDMMEDGVDSMDSPDKACTRRPKRYQIREKGCEINSRKISSKEDDEQLILKVNPKGGSDFVLPMQPIRGSASADDNWEWVQCDNCSKWRLLPFCTKGKSLPDHWLCSMLNWLPGMSSCSIAEEETTEAVVRIYQPQNHIGVDTILSDNNPGTAANFMHPEQSLPIDFPVSGIKLDLKEVPKSIFFSKNKRLNVAAGSPLDGEPRAHHTRNSTDPVLETNQDKRKSKKKHPDKYSKGGHPKITKPEGQGEPNQDCPRLSKKLKVEEEVFISSRDTGNEYDELLIGGDQKYQPLDRECSYQIFKGHSEDINQSSVKKSKFQPQASPHTVCIKAGKDNDINGVVKKRKVKSSLSSPGSLTGKFFNENDETEQRKARISTPEKKVSSSSRGNSRTDKKRKSTKDYPLGKAEDDHRSLKRELGSAATSSSSKVSDSLRSKSILRDVKSSPVESVSSSPFRSLDSDSHPSEFKILMERSEILAKDNPIRFADTKADSNGERSSAMRKNLGGDNNHQSAHDLNGSFVGEDVQAKHSSLLPSVYSEADLMDRHNINVLKQSESESSRSKNQKFKAESDKGKVKISDTYDDLQGQAHLLKEKTKDTKIKYQDKSGCDAVISDIDFGGKRSSVGILLDEQSRKDVVLKPVCQEPPVKEEISLEMKSVAERKPSTDYGEKRFKRFDQEKDEEMNQPKGKEKAGNINYLPKCNLSPYQGNGADASCVHVHNHGKAPKEYTPTKKSAIPNGSHSSASKYKLPNNAHNAKDRDAPSPKRRDGHNQAASNALKEATVLKHLADRKKRWGSAESTGLYFEAALKFLHGACLLELRGSENSKRGDVMQSMQVYRDTAKLCKFCAHQFEMSKNLACAALAYKCVEVAYLRVIYSSHPAASRDRRELQTSLQMVPGESPSSSASDIDNASNLATAERAALVRDGNSPQPAGNHVIAATNRPNFLSLLKYTQDVNYAMEASRKSQRSFSAAQAAMKQGDGIAIIKKAVNFNFHDVDGLLRLVRVALESIR